MIVLDQVTFHYRDGDFCLRVPELHVARSSTVALVGPSGTGKTTLLDLVAGYRVPDAGTVQVNGEEVSRLPDARRRDFRVRTIGLVFQEFELIEYLNVRDNFLLPYRISPSLPLERSVRDRAMLPEPSLLLCDEPTGNLEGNPKHEARSTKVCWGTGAPSTWAMARLFHSKSITLILYLPIGLKVVVGQSEASLTSRAEATPLIVGAKGSPLELVLNTLYFESDVPATLPYAQAARIENSGLATPVPVYTRFRSGRHSIVGTTLDYFDFRRLNVAHGRQIARLGECVLGAKAAARLGVVPGGSVLSSPETVFDLAGVYPLKMQVTGVLELTDTPDDEAVFVDIKTAWIIEGLAHGYQDLANPEAASRVLKREGNTVVANASIVQYNEITILHRIGGARSRVNSILSAEVAVVLVVGVATAGLLTMLTHYYGAAAIRAFFL